MSLKIFVKEIFRSYGAHTAGNGRAKRDSRRISLEELEAHHERTLRIIEGRDILDRVPARNIRH